MYRNRILLTLATVLVWYTSAAQNLEEDLIRVAARLDSASTVSITAKATAHSRRGGSRIFAMTASVERSQTASYTHLGEQEYYNNGSYQVMIDHDKKTASILKKDTRSVKDLEKQLGLDVKGLKKLLEADSDGNKGAKPSVKMISAINGIKTYSVAGVPSMKEIRVTLDMNDLTMVSLSYEYEEKSDFHGQYIVVDYTRFEHNTDNSSKLKSSDFFTIENGKAVLNSRFKGYKLVTT